MSPSPSDTLDLLAYERPKPAITPLLLARGKRWLQHTDNPTTVIANMTADDLPVAVLPWWCRGWMPTLLGCLGFTSERLMPPVTGSDSSRYGFACQLLYRLGLIHQPSPSDGLIVLRNTPDNVYSLLIHGYHLLANRAGLDGYRTEQRQALTQYYQWQQTGDPIAQLDQQSAHFLKALQPAIARETDALLFLHTLCEKVLAPTYEGQQWASQGHLNG